VNDEVPGAISAADAAVTGARADTLDHLDPCRQLKAEIGGEEQIARMCG